MTEGVSAPTAVVVIGRNEGQRLQAALESARDAAAVVVYADSASSDGSPALARELGIEVIDVDASEPLTAARGRNVGFARALELAPDLEQVQFLDGDCSLEPGWLAIAERTLALRPEVGALCGTLREREREASIWTRLADMEWASEPGEARVAGGNLMLRREAFEEVGGFDAGLVGAEDSELCFRLGKRGWTVLRLPDAMVVHDGAASGFAAWWRRSLRNGKAYAEVVERSRGRMWSRDLVSLVAGGLLLPLLALGLAPLTRGLSILAFFVLYLLWGWRIARDRRGRLGDRPEDARLYAFFCLLQKLPMALAAARSGVKQLVRIALGATASRPPARTDQ
jgi:GT2 family glycosyltransferase